MTTRVVAVLVGPPRVAPGLAAAMLEDVVDLLAGMQQVTASVAVVASMADRVADVVWPDMAVHVVPEATPVAAWAALAAAGADEAAVVAPDVPDLPPLLLGKLFSALTSADAAACPAEGGGLVALAGRLPVVDWLRAAAPDLDDLDVLARLTSAAPRRSFHVGAGWHRMGSDADLGRLDADLEGWDATRAWLGR